MALLAALRQAHRFRVLVVCQRIQEIRPLRLLFAYGFQLFGLAAAFEQGARTGDVWELASALVVGVGHQSYIINVTAIV